MSVQTGIVRGRARAKNRDGVREVLLLQVELTSKEDVQTVELMQGASDQFSPSNGSKVLVFSNGAAYKIALAVDDLTFIALEVGERAIASVLNGDVKSSFLCRINGDAVINQGTDFAVEFSKLKAGFDQLVSDHNTHIHLAHSTVPTVLSSASVDESKKEHIRL